MCLAICHCGSICSSHLSYMIPCCQVSLGRCKDRFNSQISWWRHQMERFFVSLGLCAGNSPVTGEFPSQRPVTRSFDGFFFICAWTNGWVNNRYAGDFDFRRHHAHCDVTVMSMLVLEMISMHIFYVIYSLQYVHGRHQQNRDGMQCMSSFKQIGNITTVIFTRFRCNKSFCSTINRCFDINDIVT